MKRKRAAPSPDRLSFIERVSSAVVEVIRHPFFVLFYTGGTVFWWTRHPPPGGWMHAFTDDAYPWGMWTSLASLLALWIESAVGISQRFQAKRDAVAAARMAALLDAVAAQSQAIVALLQASGAADARVAAAVARIEALERDAAEWRQHHDALYHPDAQPPQPAP